MSIKPKIPVICLECDKSFETTQMTPSCPKCGGSDIEMNYDAMRLAKQYAPIIPTDAYPKPSDPNKKQVKGVGYIKNTEAASISEIANVVSTADKIFILRQAVYDDDSQSITFEVHFKPK